MTNEFSAAEIADRQRHMYLLQKVRSGQTLTPGEIRELRRYDKKMKNKKKTIKSPKPPVKRPKKKVTKGKKRKVKRLPVAIHLVQTAAFESETQVEADGKLGIKRSLADLFMEFSQIEAAFQRGAFLRDLQKCASTAATVSESGRALGMDGLKLRELLDNDLEAADIWNSARLDLTCKLKAAVLDQAMEGKPAAIKQIEQLLINELNDGHAKADFSHITISEMVEITGRTRQTLHEWYTEYGLSRNSDKTFDMKVFLAWFEEFTQKKRGPGKVERGDPLKAAKADKLGLELAQMRGDLLDRREVVAGFLNRYQRLQASLDKRSDTMSMQCSNQPPEKIKIILDELFNEIRRDMSDLPDQLQLPDEAQELIVKLWTILAPEREAINV